MFYQSDYKMNQFMPRYKRRSLRELQKKLKIKKPEVKNSEIDDSESEGILFKYILSFCENTSIHGVKYVGQDLHWFERYKNSIKLQF